jgi:hypothetical protein
MLVGYRTRVGTIGYWVLLVSMYNRNPALIFAADDVLCTLMFWVMFLPWGACDSFYSPLNTYQLQLPETVISSATFALMCKQYFIYIFSGAIKTKSPIWVDGSALYYALSFDQYLTHFGYFLLNFQPILKVFTQITLVLEWIGPLTILIP